MYNNLYKSSYVNQEQKVRIINSNDIAAKKIDSLVNNVLTEEVLDFDSGVMVENNAVNVANLLSDEDENGFRQIETGGNRVTQARPVNKGAVLAATNQASDIVAKANADADGIIRKALEEAENIKKSAYKAARAMGYDEGIKASKEAMVELELKLNRDRDAMIEDYKAKIDEIEPSLVDVLTDIYEHVFHVDFSDRKEIIYHLAKNALATMETGKMYTLRVSTDDFGFLSMQKRELVKGSGIPVENVEFIEDKTLTQGHAFIETEGGIFDVSVNTHLENLRKTLQVLSFTKE
ncbi:MAG: hypothetical protein MJ126_00030 [Lachnospiraceae bacterium]|nr:hypothetical protein [Lachnospiraceae bacterium]